MNLEMWKNEALATGGEVILVDSDCELSMWAKRDRIYGTDEFRKWCYTVWYDDYCLVTSSNYDEASDKFDKLVKRYL